MSKFGVRGMFNFVRGKLQRWGSRQAKEELQYFVDMLEGADLDSRALTVAFATDFQNKVLVTEEFVDARIKGFGPALLLRAYRDLQKAGLLPNAAGVAIWLHSERAENDLTLVQTAKEMWRLLAESFSRVEVAADGYYLLMGRELDTFGYDAVPMTFRT